MDPEAKARLSIDAKLKAAGWVIQDMSEFDRTASLGVAVREFRTTKGNEVDYALFIDEYPCGIIEAKRDERGVNRRQRKIAFCNRQTLFSPLFCSHRTIISLFLLFSFPLIKIILYLCRVNPDHNP